MVSGGEILCIINSESGVSYEDILTIGKVYIVEKTFNKVAHIIDNRGILSIYSKDRFIPISAYRSNKIDEILE